MKILVTGTAGFIGFHLIKLLLDRGNEVVGIDNINDYYDVNLKFGRLKETGIDALAAEPGITVKSTKYPGYRFINMDIANGDSLNSLFKAEKFDIVCNLAAQAGVRYSLQNPNAYIESNIVGFTNILECCRFNDIKHLVYASSSSVYGLNEQMPFSVHDEANHPVSLYAASKKSNELMAHTYSHLFRIPTTGLRFFTVYGPWGRPDMALFLFTKAIIEGKPIQVFNQGNMSRDFTYIDDIVNGIVKIIDNPATSNSKWVGKEPDPSSSNAPYKVYNIGKGSPVNLMDFVREIENNLGIEAKKIFLPMQDGDVASTWADVKDLEINFSYKPSYTVAEGVRNFIQWYKSYYNISISQLS